MQELEPITPDEAVSLYLQHKEQEYSEHTAQAHRYRLGHFKRWCAKKNKDNLNNLTGRDLHAYKIWRKADGDLNNVTMQTQLSTLRVFLKWCETIDGTQEGLYDKIMLPKLDRGEDERDNKLDPERAMDIIDYLRKYEYATGRHVLIELLWHTGMRVGEARALDVADYHSQDQYIQVKHRPRSGTPLKNKAEGERPVGLSPEVCTAIDDFLDQNRPPIVEDDGREPLISTHKGRAHKNTLRQWVYSITRPCVYANTCPHNQDLSECEATEWSKASKCPSSESPHAIRRGSITYHLLRDVPEAVVSDRMNVSPDVLSKHYDQRTDAERLEQRRKYLTDL